MKEREIAPEPRKKKGKKKMRIKDHHHDDTVDVAFPPFPQCVCVEMSRE